MAPPYSISDKSDKRDLTAVASVARAGLFKPPSIRAGACAKITYRDPRELKPRARNPRIHSVRQIKQIAASIEEFGLVNPVWSTAPTALSPGMVVLKRRNGLACATFPRCGSIT